MAQYIGTTVITSVVAGTSLSGGGTAGAVTLNFDPGADGITIKDTTTSSATEGGNLILASDDGAVMADNHRLGVIEFKGAEDTSNTLSSGARIQAITRDAWDGSNNDADLQFYTTDGTTESLALTLDADNLATFGGKIAGPLEIEQGASGGACCLLVDNNDVDQVALDIEAANTTITALRLKVPDLTSANAIFVNADALTTGAGLKLDVDDALTTSATKSLSVIDYDKAGVTASGQASITTGLHVRMCDAATNHASGAVTMTGAQIDVDSANAQGTITQKGLILNVAADGVGDAATTSGIEMEVMDGGTDIKMMSHADTADYCTIGVTTNGATTLTTVDGGAAAANLTLTVDGNIALNAGSSSTNYTSIPSRKIGLSGGTDGAYDGDVVYFGGTTSMTIGTIYHYKSDGTWEVTNANAVATSDGLLAVALGAASDTNGMLLRGMVTLDHDPGAIGDVLFLSAASNGDATATAPSGSADVVRVIGYQVNHASQGEIWFNPDNTYIELA